MAAWATPFLARAAPSFLPVAGESLRSLRAPAVVLQFCLNLFGSAPEEHPRSGRRQEKWCGCVPGSFRWVARHHARPESGPAQNVPLQGAAREVETRSWEKCLTCTRQLAT